MHSSLTPMHSQREQAALRALEEQHMKQEKQRRQEETKANLDYSLKLKMKKKAKEVQEELAMDMKILEQMLSESSNEAMQQLQRKVHMQLCNEPQIVSLARLSLGGHIKDPFLLWEFVRWPDE